MVINNLFKNSPFGEAEPYLKGEGVTGSTLSHRGVKNSHCKQNYAPKYLAAGA